MNNTLIFLRHAETIQDKNKLISQWVLTEKGKSAAEKLATSGVFYDVEIIISSNENKAYQTAKPIADKLDKKIIKIPELNELHRDKGGLFTQKNYNRMMIRIFEDLDFTAHEWETCRHALNRFKRAVTKIDNQYNNKRILIVAHGIVMSLYFADMQNIREDIFARWKSLPFCAYGIAKNHKVFKDVIDKKQAKY